MIILILKSKKKVNEIKVFKLFSGDTIKIQKAVVSYFVLIWDFSEVSIDDSVRDFTKDQQVLLPVRRF